MPRARSSWIAVSGVMAALPLTISLIVLTGRSMRRASSDCDIPRSCRASERISPGGTAQSGCQTDCSVAMVVSYLRDRDAGDAGAVDAAVVETRRRVVVGNEDQ